MPATCTTCGTVALMRVRWLYPSLQCTIYVQCCRRNSVVIQGCHKYLDCLKQSQDYYAVIHVKVLSPIDPHGKASSESWDTRTYSGSSWDSITHRLLWKVSLESWDIQTYSGSNRDSITHRLLWKASLESWDIQTSGLSQDSSNYRPLWKSILGILGYSDILRIILGFHHP